jgi:hypothetical protein
MRRVAPSHLWRRDARARLRRAGEAFIMRACRDEGICSSAAPVVDSGYGDRMRSTTLAAKLVELGV